MPSQRIHARGASESSSWSPADCLYRLREQFSYRVERLRYWSLRLRREERATSFVPVRVHPLARWRRPPPSNCSGRPAGREGSSIAQRPWFALHQRDVVFPVVAHLSTFGNSFMDGHHRVAGYDIHAPRIQSRAHQLAVELAGRRVAVAADRHQTGTGHPRRFFNIAAEGGRHGHQSAIAPVPERRRGFSQSTRAHLTKFPIYGREKLRSPIPHPPPWCRPRDCYHRTAQPLRPPSIRRLGP